VLRLHFRGSSLRRGVWAVSSVDGEPVITGAKTKEQRAERYQNWRLKGNNAETKRIANREAYHHRKALGLCPIAGCSEDPKPGRVCCPTHGVGNKNAVEQGCLV